MFDIRKQMRGSTRQTVRNPDKSWIIEARGGRALDQCSDELDEEDAEEPGRCLQSDDSTHSFMKTSLPNEAGLV